MHQVCARCCRSLLGLQAGQLPVAAYDEHGHQELFRHRGRRRRRCDEAGQLLGQVSRQPEPGSRCQVLGSHEELADRQCEVGRYPGDIHVRRPGTQTRRHRQLQGLVPMCALAHHVGAGNHVAQTFAPAV